MSWEFVLIFDGDDSVSESLFRSQVERLGREWRVGTSTPDADNHDNDPTTYNHDNDPPGYNAATCPCYPGPPGSSVCPIHAPRSNAPRSSTIPSGGPFFLGDGDF